MTWIAMILLAAQTVGGAQTPQQNLTPQQKQTLGQYDFQGAKAALQSKDIQAPPGQNKLAPIPLLRVPPLIGAPPAGQPASITTMPAHSTLEVPFGWKAPHAILNATGATAVAVSEQLDSDVAIPTPGNDGRVMYLFGQGTPVMVCAPLRVCALELEAGEHLQSQPQIGDSRRWEITPVMSGSGLDQCPVLIVKPIEAGLETDLIISTDRRTYVVRLVSDSTRFISRLAFQYPGEDRAKWTSFEVRQDAAKHDAEVLAEQQRLKDKQAGVLQMAEGTLDHLYFDYKLEGDAKGRPERVLDDGTHTYLIYPDDGRFREMPTFLMLVNGKTELVNFRVDGTRYIIDRLFDKAILVVGVGKKQTRVTITRAKSYSGSTGKRS